MGLCMLLLIIIVISESVFGEAGIWTDDDRLRFRISELGLAVKNGGGGWDRKSFGERQDFLPGTPRTQLMEEVTYPRFVNVDDDLILTWRIGQ